MVNVSQESFISGIGNTICVVYFLFASPRNSGKTMCPLFVEKLAALLRSAVRNTVGSNCSGHATEKGAMSFQRRPKSGSPADYVRGPFAKEQERLEPEIGPLAILKGLCPTSGCR